MLVYPRGRSRYPNHTKKEHDLRNSAWQSPKSILITVCPLLIKEAESDDSPLNFNKSFDDP